MKNIEELFKSALKDQEMPYNEQAWNEMSKKLDARSGSGGMSGNLKWIIGAAGVSILTVVSIYSLYSPETSKNTDKKKNYAELKKDHKNDKETNKTVQKESEVSNTSSKGVESVESSSPVVAESTPITELNTVSVEGTPVPDNNENNVTELISPVFREVQEKNTEAVVKREPEVLRFNKVNDHCLNDKFDYMNTNTQSIWMKTPQGIFIEIGSQSEYSSNLTEKGFYELGALSIDKEFESSISFEVRDAQSPQLIVEDYLNYESGLPELTANAYDEEQNKWYLDNVLVLENRSSASFNLFKKGTYEVKISAKGANGCEAVSTSTFTVEEDYNLLAVNAFTPSSMEPRNTHFIPFALTQRTTPFTMIIVDPADGAVVFETSSADLPWDGINKNTGKMVEPNKSFLWKVILEQPEANENPEYIGTVVRL